MRTTIDSYKERTTRLDLSGIDFSAFERRPLSGGGLRCLGYMHDIEHHTVCYLRDLLATSAHRDPEITSFLACWNYEELWHGEAIGQVLDAHGEDAGTPRVASLREQRKWKDALGLYLHLGASGVAGRSFIALHMAWGAINERCTQAGYARLATLERHPVLSELLKRIMKQEGRHIDFYASEAARRLEDNPRAQRLTRLALRRFWRPVGAGVKPEADVAFLCRHLFGDDDGRAVVERIDRHIDRLPGLGGLHLLRRAVTERLAGGRQPGPSPAFAMAAAV
jgi:hypothetical protein